MSDIAFTLEEVSVSYQRGVTVVDAVSIVIERGRWLALIGPNGAGKSSLLKAMAGLVPHGGWIRFPARDHEKASPSLAKLVAYVAQAPVLPPGMSVAEYVLLARTAHLGWLASESDSDRRIVDEVLERLSLTGFAHRPVAELSGGEIQRATLARALAQQTPILLLDEPTSALDIGHQIAVLELVDELRVEHDLTIISAMHDLSTASRFADELALMNKGTLVASGSPDEVLTEATLSHHYQTPVQILTGADGGVVIVPLRSSSPTCPPNSRAGSNIAHDLTA
ncbi:MAG: ABC transporter ATP-binding protein [Actinomycetia bacterium]|nr:ABC transporter ATP-binding protein [Actinomycetes bacterium]MCP4225107.1 ABC transporter ATP-binding protein [Actinomycetes bacterium]MCP5030964.1 ABC transporter ATP-binding protein [Actinomycetes bacterium]